jgi:hypothetical protein
VTISNKPNPQRQIQFQSKFRTICFEIEFAKVHLWSCCCSYES